MDIETRLFTVEQDIKNIVGRLGKVEDKTAGAWKSIAETKSDVAELRKEIKEIREEVDEVKKDVKGIKVAAETTNKSIKVLAWVVGILALVIVVAGLVAMRNGSNVPERVVELVLPALSQVLGK